MINLLSILLSLAMLLTGAPEGGSSGPVGKMLVIDNIVVDRNGESLMLKPTVSLGVRTDGTTAAYDFFVDNGGEKLLPLQLTVDADKLLLLSDTSNTTLKLAREALGGGAEGESTDISEPVNTSMTAFGQMLGMFSDPEKPAAWQARADQLYDEIVDRGAGTSEKMMYHGDTLEVTTYEYDLDAQTLGTMAETLFDEDEVLKEYGQNYLEAVSKLEGFEDVNSFTGLYEKLKVKMHVVESISANGMSIQDSVLTMAVPGVEKPMQFDVYAVREGEIRDGTVSAELEINDLNVEVYCTSSTQGGDMQLSLTLTGNPLDKSRVEESDEGETEQEPTEDAFEGADEQPQQVVDYYGEGDEEDLFYISLDFNVVPQEQTFIDFRVELAGDNSFGLSIDTSADENDATVSSVAISRTVQENVLDISFDVHISDAMFDIRTSEENATPLDPANPSELVTGLSSDAAKLTGDADVQMSLNWLMEFLQAPMDMAAPRTTPDAGEQPEADAGQLPATAGTAQATGTYTDPEFTYLPEGYAVTDTIVDAENGFVSLTVSDGQGGNIYISLGESLTGSSGKITRYYTVSPEGENRQVTDLLVAAEDSGDYVIYNADDGVVSYSVFPDGANLPVEEVLKLIGGIRFK